MPAVWRASHFLLFQCMIHFYAFSFHRKYGMFKTIFDRSGRRYFCWKVRGRYGGTPYPQTHPPGGCTGVHPHRRHRRGLLPVRICLSLRLDLQQYDRRPDRPGLLYLRLPGGLSGQAQLLPSALSGGHGVRVLSEQPPDLRQCQAGNRRALSLYRHPERGRRLHLSGGRASAGRGGLPTSRRSHRAGYYPRAGARHGGRGDPARRHQGHRMG